MISLFKWFTTSINWCIKLKISLQQYFMTTKFKNPSTQKIDNLVEITAFHSHERSLKTFWTCNLYEIKITRWATSIWNDFRPSFIPIIYDFMNESLSVSEKLRQSPRPYVYLPVEIAVFLSSWDNAQSYSLADEPLGYKYAITGCRNSAAHIHTFSHGGYACLRWYSVSIFSKVESPSAPDFRSVQVTLEKFVELRFSVFKKQIRPVILLSWFTEDD